MSGESSRDSQHKHKHEQPDLETADWISFGISISISNCNSIGIST